MKYIKPASPEVDLVRFHGLESEYAVVFYETRNQTSLGGRLLPRSR